MQIEKRSFAGSDVFLSRAAQAVWSAWPIKKSVEEGYQANGWVYRAVSLISGAASSVPWVVFGPENELLWDHPVSKLLRSPNKHWTRQGFIEVIADWIALSGNAYIKQVKVGNRTAELWPVSPDRIAPIPSADPSLFIDGYEELSEKGVKRRSVDFTPENVIHIKLIDPSNPYRGISPLGAAARAVDVDNAQQEWNASTMQNRGVPDGIFSFKQPIDGTQAQSLTERIKERWSGAKNARKPLVLGSDAHYQRLSLSPAEMDFLESRKMNREEIFIIFGVPPQLGGSQDASTYNNFATANRIFWETTVIPLLDKIRDALQLALAADLAPGLTIGPDLSNVRALQESEDERAKVAELYSKMGVPFAQINDRFELGFEPWDGWDKPRPVTTQAIVEPADDKAKRKAKLRPLERRSVADEMAARDDYAERALQPAVADLLATQQKAVFAAIESGGDITEAARLHRKEWQKLLTRAYTDVALMSGAAILDSARSAPNAFERRELYPPELIEAVERFLSEQGIILHEMSLIENATVHAILVQVTHGVERELTTAEVTQAILDVGTFSPERALRIARTEMATAMSSGQLAAGKLAGAEKKVWVTAVSETRDIHKARDMEKVGIDERFSVQSGPIAPRFPGDPEIAADDRINCRCSMTFE